MLDRAETLLHDHYAGKDYWDVSVVMEHYYSFLMFIYDIRLYMHCVYVFMYACLCWQICDFI